MAARNAREGTGRMGRQSIGGAVLLALLCALLVAPQAAAQDGEGTIVYVQDDQLWITTPDGSQRHQVTDGSGEWSSPSMAEDGTILAVLDVGQNDDELVRMTQAGEMLSSFRPQIEFDFGIFDAEIQANGEYAFYSTIGGDINSVETATFIVFADGRQTEVLGSSLLEFPASWYPGTDLVAIGGELGGVNWFGLGDDDSVPWFDADVDLDIDIAKDGALAAITNCEFESERESCSQIEFHSLLGPPPATVSPTGCALFEPQGERRYGDVSIAPGNGAFVFSAATESDIFDVDVFIVEDFDPNACTFSSSTVLAEGADAPFWSPAPFNPTGGPGPSPQPPPPSGGSTPPQPDEPAIGLVDGGRVDGGGSADPVGQTVAVSESVWADGGADYVVLATADRFPDALAGSALAGENGPILVTPFGDQLEPRVQTEITRVTGGDGLVLILGGAAAVSEGAAAQARAAAGSNACPAPFPADCRYAGTGREHTAALIGATVLALNGGSGGRALLARGDVFADAITGGAYAAEAGVPILLTPPTSLNADTAAFLTDNTIAEVIVLGGTAAVDQPTMDALPAPARRIAGGERTATAAAIAIDLWQAEGLAGGGIVLVNVRDDNGWQTALAAAVVSALANAPQLGVENPPAATSQPTLDAAAALGGPVETHGSAALVSDQQADAVSQAAG